MSRPNLEGVRAKIREIFLLEEAQRQTAAFTASQRDMMRSYYDAAMRRLQVAQDLRGPGQAPSALSLYRQGGFFLAIALLLSKDESCDAGSLTPEAAFGKLAVTLEAERIAAPATFDRARPVLVSTDPLELDRLSAEEANARADDLEATTRWLAGLLDTRSPRELKAARIVRMTSAAVSGLVLLVAFVAWLLAPKNLAKNRPTASSTQAYSTTPDGAVDGSKNGRAGFHSAEEESPWWFVDLGRSYTITSIKVFGRSDCCYEQSIPMVAEVSLDGVTYSKIADRTQPFSEPEPWVIHSGVPGRFVRLRTLRRTYLVLGEVEIYGAATK